MGVLDKLKWLSILGLIFSLFSCEGYRTISGSIYDEDGTPLQGVRIDCRNCNRMGVPAVIDDSTNEVSPHIFYLDSNGHYKLESGLIGYVLIPPRFKLSLNKTGYRLKKVKGVDKVDVVLKQE